MGLKVLSIDPGTDSLGFAVLELVEEENRVLVLTAGTLNSIRLSKHLHGIRETHGDRIARLFAIKLALQRHMRRWQPDLVASEAPFLGRFPQAFAALTECIAFIRAAVYTYSPNVSLRLYDPPTVKLAIGVPGKANDKGLITAALRRNVDWIVPVHNLRMETLDEHANDAIAVGVCHLKTLGYLNR